MNDATPDREQQFIDADLVEAGGKCPFCGTKLKEDDTRCGACGQSSNKIINHDAVDSASLELSPLGWVSIAAMLAVFCTLDYSRLGMPRIFDVFERWDTASIVLLGMAVLILASGVFVTAYILSKGKNDSTSVVVGMLASFVSGLGIATVIVVALLLVVLSTTIALFEACLKFIGGG